jgi:7,8-dihydroneopterin 2',3'-cyclic phosphate phosphodiesterase
MVKKLSGVIMEYKNCLLGYVNEIKDKQLKDNVLDMINNPKLTNRNFNYKGLKIDDAPASTNWHHLGKGGLVQHTCVVVELCLSIADIIKKNYDIKIDRDSLIAGAALHDIAKLFEMKMNGKGFDSTDISIDHIIAGSAELYARGFPEPVVHMLASHFGEQGTTPPQTVEAVILHHADTLSAVLEASSAQAIINLLSH